MHDAVLIEESKEGELSLKPAGGYVQISTLTIGLLSWAYSKKIIGLWALRSGLALYELRIRRRAHAWSERKRSGHLPEFTPSYSVGELARFTGLPQKRVKLALGELISLGFLQEFSPERITFAESLDEITLSPALRSEFISWNLSLTKRKRIPLPRRILALLCESSSPALIAFILGAALRCIWLKPGKALSYSGRLSCSWLAKTFGLSQRAVQGAKQHLVSLQWIKATGDVSRFGELLVINPLWDRLISLANREPEIPAPVDNSEGRGATPGTNLAPLEGPSGTDSAGVSLIRESPSEKSKYQDENLGTPNEDGPGFFKSNFEERNPQDQKDSPPRLSNIRPTLDFPDTARCLELFRQAVKCGLMPDACEHSRLLWMAAIERARTVEAKNPAGVFLVLVKNKLWKHLSEGQFDAANKRIKEHLYSLPREMPPFFEPRSMSEAPPKRPPLSKDAQLVKIVRAKLKGRNEEHLVFHALRVHAGFTKERYDAAVLELNAPHPATSGFSLAFSSRPSVPSSVTPSPDAGG